MEKTGQNQRQTGRGLLNKLREMTNVSGIAAEKFFNPQLQSVMDNMRYVDAAIRSIVTGQSIEGADPDPTNTGDTRSLKDLLKSAKSNLNRREYMTTVAELARFHKKLADVIKQIGQLNNTVDRVHHEYLFQDLDESHKKQLEDLKTRWAAEREAALLKEANIMDFLHNITNPRGRALAFYEKRYPKEVKRLKAQTETLLGKSEDLLANTLISLKEMASARATRNVDRYMTAAKKISDKYQAYDSLFKDYYTQNVKNFLDKVSVPTEKVEDKGLGKTNIPVEPKKEEPPTETSGQSEQSLFFGGNPSSAPGVPAIAPATNNLGPFVPTAPDTVPEIADHEIEDITPAPAPRPVPPPLPVRKPTMMGVPPPDEEITQKIMAPAHSKFFESLESLSQEDPLILRSYISKYAQSIQGSDPIVAIKLLQLVKSVRG
jgi:hypothetical protein